MFRRREENSVGSAARALGAPGRPRAARRRSASSSASPTCSTGSFEVHEYPAEETIEVAGFELTAIRLPALHARDVRLPRRRQRGVARVLRGLGPERAAGRPRPRRRPVRLRGDALDRRRGRDAARPPLRRRGGGRLRGVGRPAAAAHAQARRAVRRTRAGSRPRRPRARRLQLAATASGAPLHRARPSP